MKDQSYPRHPTVEYWAEEDTVNTVFLLQVKNGGGWETDSVWRSRHEAETYLTSRHMVDPGRWRVYGVPAYGQLAERVYAAERNADVEREVLIQRRARESAIAQTVAILSSGKEGSSE